MRRPRGVRKRGAWGFALACSVLFQTVQPLRAQEPGAAAEDDKAAFDSAIEQGISALDAGRPEEARAFFARAHALHPSARTLRALGLADYELDHFTLAKRELEEALRNQELPLGGEMQLEVQQLLHWMRENLGTLQLRYTPKHAVATLDGEPVESDADLILSEADHELVVTADGYVTRQRTITARAGKILSLTVELTAVPAPSPQLVVSMPPTAAPSIAAPAAEPERALWPWLLGSGGAVALIAGTTLFILGQNDIARVEGARKGVTLEEIQGAHDRAPWLTGFGIGLGAAGLASLGVAAYGLTRSDSSGVALRVSPGGLLLTGQF
jgi:hypothetical protein